MTIGQSFVLFLATVTFGAVLRAINAPLWVWLHYRRFYSFPDSVYSREVFVPKDVIAGEDPWYALGCLSALVGGLVVAAGKVFHVQALVTIGAVLCALLLIPAALALFGNIANSTSSGSADAARHQKHIEALAGAIEAEPQPDSVLAAYRHLWRAELHLEAFAADSLAAETQKTDYQFDEDLVKRIEADLVYARDHPSADERLRQRATVQLGTLSLRSSSIRKYVSGRAGTASTGRSASSAVSPAAQLPLAADLDIGALIALLSSPEPDVRYQSATILGDRGALAAGALPHLEPLLNDPVRTVRMRATWALETIQKKSRR